MGKGIGFNRNIKREWLDATAAFRSETDDVAAIRGRLEPVLAQDCTGAEAIRKSVDILVNIWVKSQDMAPVLHEEALAHWQRSHAPDNRLWLHYGLTMLYYPFFWQCMTAIGQTGRYDGVVTNKLVIHRLVAEIGHLGSLERAAQRVVASLREWGILLAADKWGVYEPRYKALTAGSQALEAWLLACALQAHPAQEMPFADLVNLPALFPFRFSLRAHDMRHWPGFAMQRQGSGLDMVRAA